MASNDRAQAVAVIQAITTNLRGTWKARDFDEKTTDPIHVYVSVTRRYGSPARSSGSTGGSGIGWRIVARSVGRTVDEARFAMEDVADIENQHLIVDGKWSTPIRFESSTPPEPDGGWFSGQSTWTYVL